MEKLTTWLKEEKGRRLALCQHLKITQGALSQWKRVPPERVVAVSAFTGIPREVLRPDIFGPVAP